MERVELIISMTTKKKKQFETLVGRFSYLYCPKAVFSIGVQLEDAGDEKRFLMASPEKALCDIIASQTDIKTQMEMKKFLELMRLDSVDYENLNFSLLEKITAGYKRQSLRLLMNYIKDSHV